jgi:hypothetical protein
MSKYKVKQTPKRGTLSAQDAKEEKKIFAVAIAVTLIVILLIYLAFS